MKKEPTKQEIFNEVSRLRSACEQVKRQTKILMSQSSRLYLEIENLSADPSRRITLRKA